MFHFDKDMKEHATAPYGIKEDVMYRDVNDNPLINDFGMYVLSRLYTFHNMREAFHVKADTDIAEYVRHRLLDGNRVYRFSRELLAYLETLVAFCPYHVANDPYAAAPMDSYYDEALKRYRDQKVPYDTLHEYLTQGLSEWYARFKPNAANDMEEERDEHDDQEGRGVGEVHHAGGDDAAPSESITFSTTRKSAAPAAAAPAPAAAAAAAAAAPPGAAAGPP